MTTLPDESYSGRHKATEEEDDRETLGRDLEKERRTAGFRLSWRKMETAAQDRAGGDEWSATYRTVGVTRQKYSIECTAPPSKCGLL